MGSLNYFNLKSFIDNKNTEVFIESGSGGGTGIEHALKFPFKRLISIEIMESQVEILRAKYQDPRLEFIHGHSVSVFEKILPGIAENIFFWLDAHFPGADLGLRRYEDEVDDNKRLPLEKELLAIKRLRVGKKDVIAMDDIKIYANQGALATWQVGIRPRQQFSSDLFFEEILNETHMHHTEMIHEGYCLLEPK